MELRLQIRQKKTFDRRNPTQEIHYAGNNPKSLVKTNGGLPANRQLPGYAPNHEWIDITDSVSDLFKIRLMWTQEIDSAGETLTIGNEQKKSQSGVIIVEGEGYGYIKKWLVDDPSASFNVLEVRLQHVGLGYYNNWELSSEGIEWCEGEICNFSVTLKQTDPSLQCIRNTVIADDWQGWFPKSGKPLNGKQHPRFSYCNEMRPNGMLVVLWWMVSQINVILIPFLQILATIFAILNLIQQAVNFIRNLLGKDPVDWGIPTGSEIKEVYAQFYIESAGCGREHPAPYIRDYIRNVCDKCGVIIEPKNIEIFFREYIDIETSADRSAGRAFQNRYNPHYRATYLAPVSQKGVRRFDRLNIFSGPVKDTTTFWQYENQPLLTLDMFLDELKGVYNASWRIENNKLYFKRKDYWLNDDEIFDFSSGAPDNELLIHGLCYEWNENKLPTYIDGLYSLDAADTPGNAALAYMNAKVMTGNIDENPTFDGSLVKTQNFAGTKFRLDGADNDYVLDAFQQVINGAGTGVLGALGNIIVPTMMSDVDPYFREYADYALLIQSETTTLSKILIHDGSSMLNAKAFRPHSVISGVIGSGATPTINTKYNIPTPQVWSIVHPPKDKVQGNQSPPSNGVYTVTKPGGNITKPAWLVNYPMYFDHRFEGTLWDWFHWIDDPAFNPGTNRTITARLELCADTIERLGVLNDSQDIILGQKIKTSDPLTPEATITSIEISYDTSDEDGMYIQIKANA